jgi:hypothetical protein
MVLGFGEEQLPPNGRQTDCGQEELQTPPSHGLSMHFDGGAVQPPPMPSGPQLKEMQTLPSGQGFVVSQA